MREIACDIDNTIADLASVFLKTAKLLFPDKMKDFQMSDWITINLWKCSSLSAADVMRVYSFLNAENLVCELTMYPGAKERVLNWVMNDKVWFITARGGFWPQWEWQTLNWFGKHFIPVSYDRFIFNCLGNGRSKADHVRDLGLRYCVEDWGEEAIKIANMGVKVFLIDQPWNQFVQDYPLILRVRSWKEINLQLGVFE